MGHTRIIVVEVIIAVGGFDKQTIGNIIVKYTGVAIATITIRQKQKKNVLGWLRPLATNSPTRKKRL